MRSAIVTLIVGSVLSKFRTARLEDMLHKGIGLPKNIIDKISPEATKISKIANKEVEKINEEVQKVESHFKDTRAKYDDK